MNVDDIYYERFRSLARGPHGGPHGGIPLLDPAGVEDSDSFPKGLAPLGSTEKVEDRTDNEE